MTYFYPDISPYMLKSKSLKFKVPIYPVFNGEVS